MGAKTINSVVLACPVQGIQGTPSARSVSISKNRRGVRSPIELEKNASETGNLSVRAGSILLKRRREAPLASGEFDRRRGKHGRNAASIDGARSGGCIFDAAHASRGDVGQLHFSLPARN